MNYKPFTGLAKEVIGANSEQQVTGITSDGHPFHCDTVSFNDNDFSGITVALFLVLKQKGSCNTRYSTLLISWNI